MQESPVNTPWNTYRIILIAATLAAGSGCCAPIGQFPDGCAGNVYDCELARLIHHVCTYGELPACGGHATCGCGLGCGAPIACGCSAALQDDDYCCPVPAEQCEALHSCIKRGPPPVSYKPLMPPKFLPIPTRSVFTAVNLAAPTPTRGAVEVDFGPQLTVPGRD